MKSEEQKKDENLQQMSPSKLVEQLRKEKEQLKELSQEMIEAICLTLGTKSLENYQKFKTAERELETMRNDEKTNSERCSGKETAEEESAKNAALARALDEEKREGEIREWKLRNEIERLTTEVRDLEYQLVNTRANLMGKVDAEEMDNREKDELKRKITTLENSLDKEKEVGKATSDKLKALQDDIVNNQFWNDLDEYVSKKMPIKEDNDILQKECDMLNDKINGLMKELEVEKAKNSQTFANLQIQLKHKDEEIKVLRELLRNLELQNTKFATIVQCFEVKNRELEIELENAKTSQVNEQQLRANFGTTIEHLEHQVQLKNQENVGLSGHLEMLNQQGEEKRLELTTLQIRIRVIETIAEALKKENDESKEMRTVLEKICKFQKRIDEGKESAKKGRGRPKKCTPEAKESFHPRCCIQVVKDLLGLQQKQVAEMDELVLSPKQVPALASGEVAMESPRREQENFVAVKPKTPRSNSKPKQRNPLGVRKPENLETENEN